MVEGGGLGGRGWEEGERWSEGEGLVSLTDCLTGSESPVKE